MTISIGNNEDNDIVIKDPSISQVHAQLELRPNGHLWIVDSNSRNGIFINNRRVNKSKIDEKDQIVLGSKLLDTGAFFSRIRKIINHRKVDFTQEYIPILESMDEYNRLRAKITNPSKWPKIIRVGLSIVLIVLIFCLTEDNNIKMVLMVSAGTIPVLISLFFDNKSKKQGKLDLLRLEYEDLLKCPKCKTKLIQYTPVYMRSKSKCVNDKCQAIFKL